MKAMEQHYREMSKCLSASAKRGVPMITAGCLFWLAAGIAGCILPQHITVWVYIFGIGAIFPLGLAMSKLMKADMFAQGNPLGTLAGVVGAMQMLFAPVMILILFREPEWIPFTVGVLTGAHFLPFGVIYRSKAYFFLSTATVLTAAATGYFATAQSFLATPFAVLAVYAFVCVWLVKENKAIVVRGSGVSA
ncbi:DUF7010 family protein [Paenibacillus ginsengarvi]|uniref:Uncharacterized protein n=1 Tax=Paenibacillus ginsengarvi TaxID=400777 RepID=A0A3B0CBW7_9BACL|nr:hypothetical protein [Paenibacillus ginsengarvi]RKN80486.1 hypothetical protein D7M11_20295 [Paenibacillus ginsengarvi]